jgi:cytochrome c oxidase subunit II
MATVAVFGTMLYSIVKHWKVAGHPGKRFPSSTSLEIVWSLISCRIVAGLAYPAIRKLDQPAVVAHYNGSR